MQPPSAHPDTIVWFQNNFVRLAEANVSVLTHALHYGTGVFEGIRGYYESCTDELYLMRAHDHFARWKRNCGILRMRVEPSVEELVEITSELCRRNKLRSHMYIRPLAYKASPRVRVPVDDNDALMIAAFPQGEYLAGRSGVRAAVSSWRRVQDTAIPGRAKICGAYVNSVLAVDEARLNGHDEAIFLNEDGHVAEGATSNLFMVRDGKLVTPPVSDNILEGITRASIIELARRELKIEVSERSIDRSELYISDEIFFTGTTVELCPVLAIDHRPVGDGSAVGPITTRLHDLYVAATRGQLPEYEHWLWPVYAGVQPGELTSVN